MVFGTGCVGALFSILFNLQKINFDSMSERHLHIYEASSRILIGGIAGIVALLLTNVGLLAANFQDSLSAVLLMAFIAGASERFLPGIIEHIPPVFDNGSHHSNKGSMLETGTKTDRDLAETNAYQK